MNIDGKSHCKDCPLNLTKEAGYPACYATIDGRGLGIIRYEDIPDNVIQGTRDIAKYAGITMHQMIYSRDEIGLPYHTNGKKFYAVKEEIDEWRNKQ